MCAAPAGAIDEPAALPASLDWIACTAPGTAASSLRTAGKWSLDDPPRRFDADDWWFRTRFQLAPGNGEPRVLGFDGLATLAEVWLDGRSVLTSDNMFVAHELPLPDAAGDHELVIRCKSLDASLAQRRPRPRWKTPMIENQQLRWFRTTLLGRTPGWSPPAAAVGPWKDVWIETRAVLAVRELHIDAQLHAGTGVVELRCGLPVHAAGAKITSVQLELSRAGRNWTAPLSHTGTHAYHGELRIDQPALWWPCTHGEAALYAMQLRVTLTGSDDPVIIDLGATGFRKLEVLRDDGNFAVRINDTDIFCRGACWTALDAVTLRADPQQLRAALQQVRDAGMNMVRVGGTMVYEDDAFLDLCDSMGILLWQEFMFASMDYPDEDAAFRQSVSLEAQQLLGRLAARPSLAVLCGNSEVEQQASMWGAPRERWSPALFHGLLRELVTSLGPDVAYWPSSAHGGSFPHQPNVGTTSYYGVGAYLRPAEDARRSQVRFATECLAFANVPEDSSLARMPNGLALRVHHPQWKARTPRDLGAGWDFEDVRDFYLEALFGVNARQLRYSNHDRYLELSRAASGEMMAAAFGEWRRAGSACNGALVWFLKDLWAGAGWGIVDADQRPKAAYYYLRRALQPVAVVLSDEGCNGLDVHLVNETADEVQGTLELTLFRDAGVAAGSASRPVRIPPRGKLRVAALELFATFADLSYAYRFGPLPYNAVVATLRDLNENEFGNAYFFPGGLGALPPAPDLTASAVVEADGMVLVTVATRQFAHGISIDMPGYAVPDQYFHLAPHRRRAVRLQPLLANIKPKGTIKALNGTAVTKIEIA